MKRTIALTALVLFTSSGIAAAADVKPQQARPSRVTRLERSVRQLERKLRSARASFRDERARVATLQAQSASDRAQIGTLTSQAADLRNLLAQRTSERDAARRQAASAQAQLDAIPTPLEAAEQYLDRVVWAAEATDPSRSHGEIVSLAVMNYVADNHVSLFMRAYLQAFGAWENPTTANSILAVQAGLCGNAAIVFEALVRHFGYQVRSVELYYDDPPGSPNGHSSAEVYYDGAWHFLDPTFGLYYTDATTGNILDLTTTRADGGVEHKNDALLFNVIENPRDAGGDNDSWFVTDPSTVVEIGQHAPVG
jgi:TolA-binding protein